MHEASNLDCEMSHVDESESLSSDWSVCLGSILSLLRSIPNGAGTVVYLVFGLSIGSWLYRISNKPEDSSQLADLVTNEKTMN